MVGPVSVELVKIDQLDLPVLKRVKVVGALGDGQFLFGSLCQVLEYRPGDDLKEFIQMGTPAVLEHLLTAGQGVVLRIHGFLEGIPSW